MPMPSVSRVQDEHSHPTQRASASVGKYREAKTEQRSDVKGKCATNLGISAKTLKTRCALRLKQKPYSQHDEPRQDHGHKDSCIHTFMDCVQPCVCVCARAYIPPCPTTLVDPVANMRRCFCSSTDMSSTASQNAFTVGWSSW